MTDVTRVLHVVESWPPATTGYASRSAAVVDAQARRGDLEPHVLVTSRQERYADEAADEGTPVVAVPPGRLERAVHRVRPWYVDGGRLRDAIGSAISRWDPHLVHVHWGSTIGAAAASAARRAGIPLVAEVRFDLAGAVTSQTLRRSAPTLERVLRQRFERHLHRADLVVAASHAVADLVTPTLDGTPLVVSPNGVDHDRFGPRDHDPALAADLGLRPLTVAAITNLLHYEGVDRLIGVVAELRRMGLDVGGLVVGGGPELEGLRSAADTRGVPITFTGRVPRERVADHYALADVVVVPRRDTAVTRHASPLKVGEAMACARPVVASALGDTSTLLAGDRGVLVSPDDDGALVDAVAVLLRDRGRAAAMGARARAFATEQLDWDSAAADVAAAYASVRSETS